MTDAAAINPKAYFEQEEFCESLSDEFMKSMEFGEANKKASLLVDRLLNGLYIVDDEVDSETLCFSSTLSKNFIQASAIRTAIENFEFTPVECEALQGAMNHTPDRSASMAGYELQ